MKGGFVSIYKKMLDSWVMQDPSRLMVWMQLILRADWQDDADHTRGAVRISVRELAALCHLSVTTTMRILKQFVEQEMITMDSSWRGTVITICKYCEYQHVGPEPEKQAPEAPKTAEKPTKKRAAFIPPTVEEVRAYVEKEGLSVDPEAFVRYYAPEWKDKNGEPVKNWKLKVRMWESHNTKPNTKKPAGSVRGALAGMIDE